MRLRLRHGFALGAILATATTALAGGCQILIGLDPVELYDGGAGGGAPSCTDGVRDGTETDVDCGGGTCPPCADGKDCSFGSDCVSKVCTGGTCIAATCTDGVQNGNETDVDCGGGTCPPCAPNKHCAVATDCASGICTATVCVDNYVWAKIYGTSNSWPATGNAVAVDAAGDAVIAGNYDGTIAFGGPTLTSVTLSDFFVAKVGADGGYLWSNSYGDSGMLDSQFGIALATDPAGEVLFGGNFVGSVNFGGGVVTAQNSVLQGGDLFAAKLDASGGYKWSKDFPGTGLEGEVYSIATDATGAFYAIGHFEGSVNFGGSTLTAPGNNKQVFLVKLDSDGNHLWSNAFGDAAGAQVGYGLAVDPRVTSSSRGRSRGRSASAGRC